MKWSEYFAWTEERVALLQRMWDEGTSGSIIASTLGTTRNSVIGKVQRLGLGSHPHNPLIRKPRKDRRLHPRLPGAIVRRDPPHTAYTVQPEYIPVDPIRFLDRRMEVDRQCAFIAGDPKLGAQAPNIQCCGSATVGGTSWCQLHLGIVSQPSPKRDRRSDNGKSPSRFIGEGV